MISAVESSNWRKLAPQLVLAAAVLAAAVLAAAVLAAAVLGVPDPLAADTPHNRLAGESSPYLLLHQDNPVDWYPWGEAALTRARNEDKPIFLSIGYSTCYWCHVMERESFSAPAIANWLNTHFINIKVDREERPDLDAIYLTATQVIAGRSGWPASVFLTPELEPFFAGTYFPPEDRPGMSGFMTVIQTLSRAFKERRSEVEAQAEEVARVLRGVLNAESTAGGDIPEVTWVESTLTALKERFDPTWGGFGTGPKFPSAPDLLLLAELADQQPRAAEMLGKTLDAMARGGLYDQLGGGFHRYTVDREWRVPHFEKMLYDNGLLLELYARWQARTQDPQAARIVAETAAFLARELSGDGGGLGSAIDAASEEREGAFYVWSRSELEAVLSADERAFLAPTLGFGGTPNFEGKEYVLHLPERLETLAASSALGPANFTQRWQQLRQRLLARRAERPRPATDDKVLTDWNGLAIAGLAIAGHLRGEPALVEQAARAARFVLRELRPSPGPLLHVWRAGQAKIPAYLADYVYFVRGLLALHSATGSPQWLDAATALTAEQIQRLRDPQGGFFAAPPAADLLVRARDCHDDALPAANAIAVLNLLTLAEKTGESRWREEAAATLKVFAQPFRQRPQAYRSLALAVWRYHAHRGAAHLDGEGKAAATSAGATALTALSEEARAVVKVTAQLGGKPQDRWRPLVVRLLIAPGWHVNADKTSTAFLLPTTLNAVRGELRAIRYPPPERLQAGWNDQPLAVWSGEQTLSAELRLADAIAEIVLAYQACDHERCLPPVSHSVQIAP